MNASLIFSTSFLFLPDKFLQFAVGLVFILLLIIEEVTVAKGRNI
jgi:hypothetical protein